ncbi:helix-turn-helix domain-containing protein [bacterium]|nr:helix-turn-helix domain-containing protein [bacterium]MDC0890668.1 IclR family transcriptional regulator C-terminal domain-containing protein [Candidatus Pelagibacter sp.]
MKLNKNTVGVEAVNKALEILNCFTEKNEALTVTKIAQITGDHKSRISRISKSLENFGYIRKIKSGEFKIGHSIPRLYEIYDNSFNLKNSIKSELDFISSKTKETASFFVRQNDVRVCIQTSTPNKSIIHLEEIGGKKPLNKGSSGHILSAYNNLEINDKDKVLKNGYAMTFGERDSEMASVSVPIFRKKNHILGALTIAGHISNFNKKNCLYFLNVLRSSKVKIEKNLIQIQ